MRFDRFESNSHVKNLYNTGGSQDHYFDSKE